MIIKQPKVPYHVQQYEAYERRLVREREALRIEIKEKLKRYRTGFKGEKSIDYPLNFLPKDYLAFHNLRFFNSMYHFQMDWLILTPRFFIILESKNIPGKLTLVPQQHHLSREIRQKIDIFEDPVDQAENQKDQFEDWLLDHCRYVPDIPIEFLVINSSPTSHLQITNQNISHSNKIVRRSYLHRQIKKISDNYHDNILTKQMLTRLTKQLLKSNEPLKIDLIGSGKIRESDIIRGVQCPHCNYIPMQRYQRRWNCPTCHNSSIDAHVQALRDYCLIFGPAITNKQCREFLLLDSIDVAKQILQKLSVRIEGKTKGTIYYLNANE